MKDIKMKLLIIGWIVYFGLYRRAECAVRGGRYEDDTINDERYIGAMVRNHVEEMHQDHQSGREGNTENDTCPPSSQRRVWAFGIGRMYPPMQQLDKEKMQVVGLSVDMMQAACEVAREECVFVHHFDRTICWSDETQRSAALDNRHFDACVSYHPTPERLLSYSFVKPFTKERPLALYVRRNDDVQLQDLLRVGNNVSIGFISNTWLNPTCLRRNGIYVSDNLTSLYQGYESGAFEALQIGMFRVLFVERRQEIDSGLFQEVDVGDKVLSCASGGHSVMMRKDNVELKEWLDPAIQRVMRSPSYQNWCYIWSKIFNQDTNCIEMDLNM